VNGSPQKDYSSILARLSMVALYIVTGTGIAAIVIGYIIIGSGFYPVIEHKHFRNILFIVSLLELAALQVIKRSLIARIDIAAGTEEINYQRLLFPTLVIAAACSGVSIYGLIAVIMGSSLEVLLLFVAISLIGYQLFRIRARDLPE